ncbi:kelch-like protein diablo [Mercenaria mercenaria]|uniref:kelch-like protein diablo n=1 Tax=Mercenaria mercenaria TaxID=6596 RepID=UPI00234F550D|nr:kelch-like protein diablo [Mercenaria mercenaria]
MNHKQKHLSSKNVEGYRIDFIRRKCLQNSFKGNEKGYKPLQKLPETIHTGMEVLWRQNFLCDVELYSNDRRRFRAHKLVLSTCCDYFYDIFIESQNSASTEYSMIELDYISGSVLEILLEAMYTGRLKVEAGNVDDILSSAIAIGMYSVIDACEEFLLEHASKDNCLQLLGTASKYNLNRLTDVALEIAAQNFQTVSKQKTIFRNLPVEHLVSILKRNDLDIDNELQAFHRVRSWIEENKSCRLQHAAELLATIRLPLLNPAEVIDKVECYEYLMEVAACQKMVKECLHYHLMPARQCLLQSPRTVPRLKANACLVTIGGAPRLETEPLCDDVMRFNSDTNQWELATKLPAPRQHHGVAVLNGFLYVAGGEEVNGAVAPSKTMFRFDPRNGTWMETAHMSTPRQSFQLGVLNSAIYAVGGRVSKNESLASVERYDPSLDKWEEVAQLCSPRRCAAVGVINGKLYAVGGSGNKYLLSRVERFTPAENRWEILKSINTPRFFGHLLPINGYLYLVGGAAIDEQGNLMCTEEIERFSPDTNQWSFVAKMRTPRSEFGCTHMKEKIFIVGGYNWNTSKRPNEVECFDTETLMWTTLPEQKRPLVGVTAAMLTLYDKRDYNK